MVRATQGLLFTHQDLPLWSRTAPTAVLSPFAPQAEHPQGALFSCRLCHDTGIVRLNGQAQFCTCEAGRAVRSRMTQSKRHSQRKGDSK